MEESYVGKTLPNENGEEYIILNEVTYKSIPFVYAMKIMPNEEEGEKIFFQIATENEDIHLVNIDSPKMIDALFSAMFKQNAKEDKPRRIKENESIQDYFAYLEEYYRSKVVTIM